jgi:RNA recognition motif-containing protein
MGGYGGDAVPTRKKKDVPKHVKDFLQKESVVDDVFENIPTMDDFVGLQGTKVKKQKRQMKNEIYVRGIPWEMENEELKEVFAEFKPKLGRAMKTENGTRSLGFGFVLFATEAQAQAAIQAMNGKELPKKDGGVTQIAVSLSFERAAKPKERMMASVRHSAHLSVQKNI